jgi:hypothetical protein
VLDPHSYLVPEAFFNLLPSLVDHHDWRYNEGRTIGWLYLLALDEVQILINVEQGYERLLNPAIVS